MSAKFPVGVAGRVWPSGRQSTDTLVNFMVALFQKYRFAKYEIWSWPSITQLCNRTSRFGVSFIINRELLNWRSNVWYICHVRQKCTYIKQQSDSLERNSTSCQYHYYETKACFLRTSSKTFIFSDETKCICQRNVCFALTKATLVVQVSTTDASEQ